MLVIAGEDPSAIRQELWKAKVLPSFKKVDGLKRAQDLIAIMKPVTVAGNVRSGVFPAKDERVMRVVRKVIRGLCYYHRVISPISDQRIWADVLKYPVPQEFLDEMGYAHRENDIVEYRWEILD